MTKNGKILYSIKVDGLKSGHDDVYVGVYGVFTTTQGSGQWLYYLVSYKNDVSSSLGIRLTPDWHIYSVTATVDVVESQAKKIDSVEAGKQICDDFKSKWISGSNSPIQQRREEKLNTILKEEK